MIRILFKIINVMIKNKMPNLLFSIISQHNLNKSIIIHCKISEMHMLYKDSGICPLFNMLQNNYPALSMGEFQLYSNWVK
jgi:hypothetical protein